LIVLGETFVAIPDDHVLGDQIEQLAGETQMWAQAIQLYEGGIQTIGEGSLESIPLRMRVAQWYDGALEQPQHAVTHYQNIQQIDPENFEVLGALESLYEKHAHWGLAAQLIETRLQRITDLDEGSVAWKKLAQIRHEHLEDLDGALIAYQEVLTYDPDDLDALRALKKLYAMKQDFNNLIDVLERESALVEEADTQIENLLRVAEIKEVRLNDVAGAILTYESAYEIDPQCVDALMSLELLYRQQKNFVELQRVYEALIVARTDSAEQLSTYSKLARLQLEDLDDREGAIDSYRRMFYIDPQHTEAVTTLDRLYREEQRWEELKDIYEQYIDRAPDADHTMVRLVLSDLCEVLYPDSHSAKERAISYLAPIIENDSTHLEALSRLSVLQGQLGNWNECVRYLSAEIEYLTDRDLKIEKMYHLGMAHIDHLDDPDLAIEWMKRALELNPTYSPAMIALKDIYERRGEYQDIIRILTMMEAQATSDNERSKCYFEMGRIYTQLLGDNNTGLDYYSRAIDLDPTNVDVAPFLVEVYLRDERWERAKPLLELLIQHHEREDLTVRRENHFRLAQCAQRLHHHETALEHYQHAYRLDSTHLPTLEGLAELYLGQDRWEDAANMLQAILIHHGERLNPSEKIDVMLKQGKAKFMVGDYRRTLDLLSRVIEIDASHREAIDLLIQTYERREKWEEAVYYRRRRLELTEDADAQFDELIQIGETFRDRLQQPRSAIEAYENALQISEQSRQVFKELLPLYESVSDWQSTIQLLNHFAQLEEDGPTKAKYLFAIGALQRDQLNDNIQAVRSFDRALDANPLELKAFSAIEELLAYERNFERQDRYFRKMLKRATENNMGGDMVFELAKALGEINRSRLGNYSEAIKAYNIALSKRPDDVATRTVIAELFEREQNWDAAVLQHREILRLDIRQLNSLHKLFQLFVGQGRYDEAWCIAQSLVCLRHAREDEQDFYGQHHSRKLGDIRRHLENDHWAYLIHPQKSPLMDRLFERLYPYNAPAMQQNHKMYGVHKRRDVISPTEQTPFNSVFEFISRVTRFERLTCFNAPSGSTGLRSMNTEPPAVMVGPDMQRSAGMKALAFSIAKLLFLMTPHALVATLDSDYESRRNRLKIIIFTLMRMAGIEVQDFDMGLIDVYRRIDDADLAKINALLNEMQTDQRAHLDVSRWLEGLDHTANRLGFLLCNDLVEATQAIRNESVIISRASVSDRIQELILFSISDEYFAPQSARYQYSYLLINRFCWFHR
jgi:tetratricopeptide (TPR) repeat protein